MNIQRFQILAALALALGAFACGEDADPLAGRPTTPAPSSSGEDPGSSSGGTPDPKTCTPGRAFMGMGGLDLVAGRVVANAGVDRGRFKPYSSLAAEYQRVLGNTPASLAGAADTFGKPEPRWYDEPSVGSVVLQTSYTIAFDGCLTYTATAPEFANTPTAADASTQCAAMTKKFWSRTASPDQITACADVAVSGSASIPDARKRWAYACASVLTAAGFLTY